MVKMKAEPTRKRDQVLALAEEQGLVRPRDAERIGVDPAYLRRLAEDGSLTRMARGLYRLSKAELTEHHSLAEVSAWCPDSVICLASAARFHNLGTENPGAVWMALPRGRKRPVGAGLPELEVVWLSPEGLSEGVEKHLVEGVQVSVTSPARTVVDFFRFEGKIGREAALDVLKDAVRDGVRISELRNHAMRFRVWNKLQPLLEALV
jgi:predicted transcriptional regulator of viral defense system